MENPFRKLKKEENIQRPEKEERPEIPLFDKLSPHDKRFVLKIKELNDIPEEDFLKMTSVKIKRLIKGKKVFLEGDLSKVKKEYERDRREKWLATMWKLVNLHLLELKDFTESGGEVFYSYRTRYLINIIFNRIIEINSSKGFNVPDRSSRSVLKIRIDSASSDEEKLKLIHALLIMFHAWHNLPVAGFYVKDLWRWSLSFQGEEGAFQKSQDFFEKLSNLGNYLRPK